MEPAMEAFILDILKDHNIMSLATVRTDGYPQVTTVAYANDGLDIYVAASADSQKVANIRRSNKVSLTVDRDYEDWHRIQGLSLAGTAELLEDPAQIRYALHLLGGKFSQMADMPEPEDAADLAVLRIRPQVISVLDYTRGLGHSELVEV